jgi:oxygen-independent coproporphyrinogen III oxidase
LIVYSMGGIGVGVGWGVAVGASVGVGVTVAVRVGVEVCSSSATLPVERSTIQVTAAPIRRTMTSKPMAIGRFRVNSGNRGALTDFASDALAVEAMMRPHTTQRVLFSASFEPQVGQILGVGEGFAFIVYLNDRDSPGRRHYTINRFLAFRESVHMVSSKHMKNLAVYIHFPFCKKRCNYCDFNTYAQKDALIEPYISSVCQEFEKYSHLANEYRVISIYFGGGTPSLLASEQVSIMMESLKTKFDVCTDPEVTMEVNPGTVTPTKLIGYYSAGINRLSMGCQSFLQSELEILGRIHSVADVHQAFTASRKAGFSNVNLDLIFGIPGQSVEDWKTSLAEAIELDPEHFSLYALTIEENTPLFKMIADHQLLLPDDDVAAEMYEFVEDFLKDHGYQHYEISNWAKRSLERDFRSRHNLQYWLEEPYLGFGAGAHSFFEGYRVANEEMIEVYIRLIGQNKSSEFPHMAAVKTATRIGKFEEMQETMMLGLRLTEDGVNVDRFKQKYGRHMGKIFEKEISKLEGNGLLEWLNVNETTHLRLTQRGRMLGNRVFREFIGKKKGQ